MLCSCFGNDNPTALALTVLATLSCVRYSSWRIFSTIPSSLLWHYEQGSLFFRSATQRCLCEEARTVVQQREERGEKDFTCCCERNEPSFLSRRKKYRQISAACRQAVESTDIANFRSIDKCTVPDRWASNNSQYRASCEARNRSPTFSTDRHDSYLLYSQQRRLLGELQPHVAVR